MHACNVCVCVCVFACLCVGKPEVKKPDSNEKSQKVHTAEISDDKERKTTAGSTGDVCVCFYVSKLLVYEASSYQSRGLKLLAYEAVSY